jgi:hypothetical protein
MPSTEVGEAPSQALTPQEEEALAQRIRGKVDTSTLKVPLVKLAQALTGEVVAKRATAGEYINAVTGASYGPEFEFILADTGLGAFARIDGEGYTAQGVVVPDNWPAQYAGQVFAEIEDFEPNFRAAVNAGKREWGKGPPISQTHNYLGYVITEDFDELAGANRLLPVRVSLMRKNARAAETINTLLVTWPTPWAYVLKFGVTLDTEGEGPYYVATVTEGEPASTPAKTAAVNLANQLQSVQAEFVGDDDDHKVKPQEGDIEGDGMEVG